MKLYLSSISVFFGEKMIFSVFYVCKKFLGLYAIDIQRSIVWCDDEKYVIKHKLKIF